MDAEQGSDSDSERQPFGARGRLELAVQDLIAAAGTQARRDCADELRALIDPAGSQHYVDRDRLYELAEKWAE